jgi:hypothetical protein
MARYGVLVALVSTRERESAAEALRRHFLSGRLTLDEFGDRVRLALDARDGRDLRRAIRGLPPTWRDGDELRRVAGQAKRRAVVATVKFLWLAISFILLVAFLTDGMTASAAVGYAVAWLLVSALAWRAARRT